MNIHGDLSFQVSKTFSLEELCDSSAAYYYDFADNIKNCGIVVSETERAIFQLANRFDGAYSAVYYTTQPDTVVKFTSCKATQEFFVRQLELERMLKEGGVSLDNVSISGLPRIVNLAGVTARDAEGFEYQGFVLERLFGEEELWGGNSEQRETSCKIQNLRTMISRLYAVTSSDGPIPTVAEDLLVCKVLSHLNLYKTGKAFAFLADFIKDTQASLDLLAPGNILADKELNIVLADPVAYMREEQLCMPL